MLGLKPAVFVDLVIQGKGLAQRQIARSLIAHSLPR